MNKCKLCWGGIACCLALAGAIVFYLSITPTEKKAELRLPNAAAEADDSDLSRAASPAVDTLSTAWNIRYHGTCCEGNMAAHNDSAYVLLPELIDGNDILESTDKGLTWTLKYPPVHVSDPYGIEGDLQAIGNDVLFFGTLVHSGVSAVSRDQGETWNVYPIPVAFAVNDQAWSYLAPFTGGAGVSVCPQGQTAPYILGGWFRIGSVAIFSCDGGVTWPIQTPLFADADPIHVACITNATPPVNSPDSRIPMASFAYMKSGRFGGFGTDKRFHWADTDAGNIYVCKTSDFGLNWSGVRHPIAPGPVAGGFVTHVGFDERGTMYVMHGDKVYISFNQGSSFAFTHTMPKYANDPADSERGSDQFFVVKDGAMHLAVAETLPTGSVNIWYLKGTGMDTATPVWEQELVDVTGAIRRDFVQIALDSSGHQYISYTTPTRQVTTATRLNNPPIARLAASPQSGQPPLLVNFDAAASSDADSGAIASYTFNFGDGSPTVTQTTPTISRTYTALGTYTASVTVKDSRGLESLAPATQTINALPPTASNVSVAGRVMTPDGHGISRTIVTISDGGGNSRQAMTNAFGYYRFDEVAVGQTYVVTVRAKRYSFESRVVSVSDQISDLDFMAVN